MKVIIFADKNDFHAVAVSWGLKKLNIKSEIWSTIGPSKSQRITYQSDEEKISIGDNAIISSDIIWLRRILPPEIDDSTSPNDIKFVENESNHFMKSIIITLEENNICINKKTSEIKIDNKIKQLRVAKKIGFLTPRTIITNSYESARKFIESSNKKSIYKTFLPHLWKKDKKVSRSATIELTLDMIDEKTVNSCPMLIQDYIEKLYEVRVNVFGDIILCVKITKKDNTELPIDWRPAFINNEIDLEVMPIPDEIERKVLNFI